MDNIVALLVAGVVLAAAGTAFAGEPTGRYQGQPTSAPYGAEQVYADYSHVGQAGPAAVKDIPAGTGGEQVDIALHNVGRALMVKANTSGTVDLELAARAAQLSPLKLAQQ